MVSSHNDYNCEGHFEAYLYIMSYFKGRHNSQISLYPSYPTIDDEKFKDSEWTDFYDGIKEEIPPNTPAQLDKSVDLGIMVDINHTGDKLTRKSHTGILI